MKIKNVIIIIASFILITILSLKYYKNIFEFFKIKIYNIRTDKVSKNSLNELSPAIGKIFENLDKAFNNEHFIEVSKIFNELEERVKPYYEKSKYRNEFVKKIEDYGIKSIAYLKKVEKKSDVTKEKKELQKLKEEIFIICDKIDEEYKDKK